MTAETPLQQAESRVRRTTEAIDRQRKVLGDATAACHSVTALTARETISALEGSLAVFRRHVDRIRDEAAAT